MLDFLRKTLTSPFWEVVSVSLALFLAMARFFPNASNSQLGNVLLRFRVIGIYIVIILLISVIAFFTGTNPDRFGTITITYINYNLPKSTTATLTPTPDPSPTQGKSVIVKVTPTKTVATGSPQGISGGNSVQPFPTIEPKPTPIPTSTPKPTPTPQPPAYPRIITENLRTPCDSNYPDYIAGEIDTVETVNATTVIYSITFFNNSNQNLGLNTYTMGLENDSTGTSSNAQQPPVPINAHSSNTIRYEFDNISITSHTNYSLSWDISQGNVFTCTFPVETLSY